MVYFTKSKILFKNYILIGKYIFIAFFNYNNDIVSLNILTNNYNFS
jgi:hypothetical protein